MPWTYKSKDPYEGNKIGSLYGVLTYISEHRKLDEQQLSEIASIKHRYHEKRYVTPEDIKLVFRIVGETEELKTKRTTKKKKAK